MPGRRNLRPLRRHPPVCDTGERWMLCLLLVSALLSGALFAYRYLGLGHPEHEQYVLLALFLVGGCSGVMLCGLLFSLCMACTDRCCAPEDDAGRVYSVMMDRLDGGDDDDAESSKRHERQSTLPSRRYEKH